MSDAADLAFELDPDEDGPVEPQEDPGDGLPGTIPAGLVAEVRAAVLAGRAARAREGESDAGNQAEGSM